MTIEATKLRELIAKATDSDLSDGGRYFAETCNDLTNCRHGDTGEYQDGHDGELVEYLWNNRSLVAAALEGAYPDIGPDPMQGDGDRSLAAATGRLFMAYAKQQPGIPSQTALVWRFDIGSVKNELLRLEGLTRAITSTAEENADLARRLAVERNEARFYAWIMREALEVCRLQFAFYAEEHRTAGKVEKAATNQRYANRAAEALGTCYGVQAFAAKPTLGEVLDKLMQERMLVCADKAEHYAYAAALSDVAAALMPGVDPASLRLEPVEEAATVQTPGSERVCPGCEGSGHGDVGGDCWPCHGTGKVRSRAQALPADVRRLVIAARRVADVGGITSDGGDFLDAVEAFSSRVPYDDEPEVEA